MHERSEGGLGSEGGAELYDLSYETLDAMADRHNLKR